MRKLLAVLALALMVGALFLVPRAEAAETYKGTIIIQDAGCVHNLFPVDGGAFPVAPIALVTIQPDQNAYVCVDEQLASRAPTCGTANTAATIRGVYVPANTAFPSSCKPAQPYLMADGGMVNGVCVITVCASGVTSLNAPVWERKGNEW